MKKKQSTLSHYDVFVKENGKWEFDRKEKELPERRSKTAMKYVPRYTRNVSRAH